MFERFTAGAREAVVTAQAEAQRLGHRHIGSEHLVLALTKATSDDPARRVLAEFGLGTETCERQLARITGGPELDEAAMRSVGIDLAEVRRRTEAQFGPGALDADEPSAGRSRRRRLFGGDRGHLPFSDDARKALELALREAVARGHKEITSTHLLLGLLRGGGLGLRVLEGQGASAERLRATVDEQWPRTA